MPQAPQLTPEQYEKIEPHTALRTMKIIAGALMFGLTSFAFVVGFIWSNGGNQPDPPQNQQPFNPMIIVGIFLAATCVVARFIVPAYTARSQVAQIVRMWEAGSIGSSRELLGRLVIVAQTKLIIEFALLEGPGFFNLIVVMQTHSMIPVGIVAGLLLLMALNFPTLNKLLNWLELQQQQLDVK